MKYPHLAARVFNTPLLIHPQKLDAIIAGLGGRLLDTDLSGVAHAVQASALPAELFSTRRVEDKDRRPGYAIIDGVAVIYASGVLAHRGRFVMASSDRILGYNDLAAALEMAQADTDVHAVLQVFDTPGGEAQGAFEYHDRLREVRGNKPVWGIADGLAASAGYLAAAGLEHFAITRTGYAGSIGVVMRHVDLSQALAQEGIRVTHIYPATTRWTATSSSRCPTACAPTSRPKSTTSTRCSSAPWPTAATWTLRPSARPRRKPIAARPPSMPAWPTASPPPINSSPNWPGFVPDRIPSGSPPASLLNKENPS